MRVIHLCLVFAKCLFSLKFNRKRILATPLAKEAFANSTQKVFESVETFLNGPKENITVHKIPSALTNREGQIPLIHAHTDPQDISARTLKALKEAYSLRRDPQEMYSKCSDLYQQSQRRVYLSSCSSLTAQAMFDLRLSTQYCNDVANLDGSKYIEGVRSLLREYDTLCTGQCANECENGGRCIGHNMCKCAVGFTGPTCQHTMCSPPCTAGHGRCARRGQCECDPGFSGPTCAVAVEAANVTPSPTSPPDFYYGNECVECVEHNKIWCLKDGVCVGNMANSAGEGVAPMLCPATADLVKQGMNISTVWPPVLVKGKTGPCLEKYKKCATNAQNLILTTNRLTLQRPSVCNGLHPVEDVKNHLSDFMEDIEVCRDIYIASVPRTLGYLEINQRYEDICIKLKESSPTCLHSYSC